MNSQIKELIERVENLGWTVAKEGENEYRLSKYSPQGQDFSIIIEGETTEDFINNIGGAYEDFDISEETYLRLDNRGHGINSALYDIRDVLEDMEACEQMILGLYRKLS